MNNIVNTKNQLNQDAILRKLKTFSGTEKYHRYSSLHPRFLLTDGTLYLAKSCSCYWLFDYLASQQSNPVIKNHKELKSIQFWKLEVEDSSGLIICEWDAGQVVYKERIGFTDFPLESIRIWIIPTWISADLTNNNIHMVAMLPSEY